MSERTYHRLLSFRSGFSAGKERNDEREKRKRPGARERGARVPWKKSVLKILTPEALGAARQGTVFFVRAAMEGRRV